MYKSRKGKRKTNFRKKSRKKLRLFRGGAAAAALLEAERGRQKDLARWGVAFSPGGQLVAGTSLAPAGGWRARVRALAEQGQRGLRSASQRGGQSSANGSGSTSLQTKVRLRGLWSGYGISWASSRR